MSLSRNSVLNWADVSIETKFYLSEALLTATRSSVLVLAMLERRELVLLKSVNRIQADRLEVTKFGPLSWFIILLKRVKGLFLCRAKSKVQKWLSSPTVAIWGHIRFFTHLLLISDSAIPEGKPSFWPGLQGVRVILLVMTYSNCPDQLQLSVSKVRVHPTDVPITLMTFYGKPETGKCWSLCSILSIWSIPVIPLVWFVFNFKH